MCIFICTALYFLVSSGINEEDVRISGIRRSDAEKTVSINAYFEYENEKLGVNSSISIKPKGYVKEDGELNYNTEPESWLKEFADDLIDEISLDSKGDVLTLPSEKDGVGISWVIPKEDKPIWLFPLALLVCLFFFFSKDDEIKKREKKNRVAFELEIPNLTEQLVLILNSGLVTEKAFEELISETRHKKNPLYSELARIYDESKADNTPLFGALYSFALEYGQKDFLRFATLLYEHSGRGGELAQKLMDEGSMQYAFRLNNAKAKVKEAETKLCFPLVLLLFSLIIITAAPALMNM